MGRAVVLTTHHLDEAEVLADRVIIMSRGRVRCAGTPAHLRAHFGLGFTLSLALARGTTAAMAAAAVQALAPSVTVAHATALKADAIAGFDDGIEEEVVLRVPAAAADCLADLCDALDASSAHSRAAAAAAAVPEAEAGTVSLPTSVSVSSYAVGTLDLGSIFMAVVGEEKGEEEEEDGVEHRQHWAPAALRALCGSTSHDAGASAHSAPLLPLAARSKLSPMAALGAPDDYGDALETLCANRPALPAGLRPFAVRFSAHFDALLRRRLATSRRDVVALLIQVRRGGVNL